ncbi:DUF2065 domain-containing protein [Vibrio sp. SS-MA-C1-2]|uniref:DUF2065 domain-containing protein n=1 Tax=Vibrio sp. SS-MA-C1-2 TaxID=2908646 RepID=UPI001F45295C|nr:DUF2065 domain-containing protein [Vibrio sp. SS-MA-C1-2]UJF19536.1 DUF2065 domain-containing protein [Vibrio sp. SS-MA-C1-2]
MSESSMLWAVIGFLLIIESIGPLFFPKGWRAMMTELSSQPDNLLRRIGGCLFVTGIVIIYMMLL